MRADDGEVCHAHLTVAEHAHTVEFVAVAILVLAAESRVYLLDYLINSRKTRLDKIRSPFLERLRHDRVVGVRDGVDRRIPRLFPRKTVFVEKNTHHFRYCERGVRVVDVDRDFFG